MKPQEFRIIIEKPHQFPRIVWWSDSDADLISRINQSAERHDTGEYDMQTVDGCLEWNAHDLSGHWVLTKEDLSTEWLEDPKVREAAIEIGWIDEPESAED